MPKALHQPVLVERVVEVLAPRPGETVVDLTVGLGGHALALARALGRGRLVGIDRDPRALALAAERLGAVPPEVEVYLHRAPFSDAPHLLDALGISGVDVVLADLGVSSLQLDEPGRGFAYRHAEDPLDLRMGPDVGAPAWEWIAAASEEELAEILARYGELRTARALARRLCAEPPRTVGELLAQVRAVEHRERGRHVWARVLQALRIWVNDELGELERLLAGCENGSWLRPGTRLAILAYHSLEDRIVKQTFRRWERGCVCPPEQPVCTCGRQPLGHVLFRGAITPDADEVAANPRARSARLRVFRFEEVGP